MSSTGSTSPGITRKVRSPRSSAMLKGGWSLRWTPPAVTSATVAAPSSPSKGVNGTQRRDICVTATSRGLPQDLEDLLVVGLLVDLVNVLVDDLPLLIDDEERPFGVAFRTVGSVSARHLTLGLEVRQEIVGYPAEALRPRGVARHRVDRNTHHVGIRPLEAAHFRLVGGHLDRSDRGPGERVEGDEHVLLPAEVRESDLLALSVMARELEVRSGVAHVDRHDCVPPQIGFSPIGPTSQSRCGVTPALVLPRHTAVRLSSLGHAALGLTPIVDAVNDRPCLTRSAGSGASTAFSHDGSVSSPTATSARRSRSRRPDSSTRSRSSRPSAPTICVASSLSIRRR